MKNYIYGLLVIGVIASCKSKPSQESTTDSTKTVITKSTVTYKGPLFAEYAGFVKKLDDKMPENATIAAKKYVELFKGKDTATCDTAFLIFNKFYKQMSEALEDVNEKDDIDLEKYFAYTNSPKNIPQKVTTYVANLKANGFDLAESEGTMYITQDWDFAAKYFYDLVSPSMKSFLQEINIENKQVYQEDAGIIVGADTLVDRAVWWERFAKTHTGFIWKSEVSATKKEYLNVLLRGMDNTPVFEANTLDSFFEKTYNYMSTKYSDTETWKLAKPVYDLLRQGKKADADKLTEQYSKRGLLLD